MAGAGGQVLHDLVDEDDRVLEAWYLLALATLAGDELEEAAEAAERGLTLGKAQGLRSDDPLWLAFEGTKALSSFSFLDSFLVRSSTCLFVCGTNAPCGC